MATKIMECDLVVLGAGGAGLVAAVKASEDGVKKVIILEKAKKAGGSSWFAGGPGVGSQGGGGRSSGGQGTQVGQGGPTGGQAGSPGSQGGAPGGMGGSPGGAQGGMPGGGQGSTGGFSSWFTTKVGSENFVKTARMEKYKDLPDPSIGPGRGGTFLVTRMVEFCKKQGIEIFYETPAKKFITDARGKVTGVLADAGDGEVQINCKACVIAAGGFGRNYEKLKKYWPESYNNKEIFFLCPPGMMGDGIDMAEAAGAYIDQTKWNQGVVGGFFADGPMHHPYSWAVQSLMQGSGMVFINLEGRRWQQGRASIASQPGGVVFSVGDNDIIEAGGAQLVSGGGGMGGGMMAQNMSNPESNEYKAIRKWKEDLEYEAAIDDEGAHGHHAKKANTLVELALKMDIDPAIFVKTIEEYNRAVESGKDEDLGSMPQMGGQGGPQGMQGGQQGGPPGVQEGASGGQGSTPGGAAAPGGMGGGMPGGMQAQSRRPIKTPPFWAIYGHRFSQCTKGLNGIAVNSNFEVLNPKGEAMPGLFAAGDNCTKYLGSGAAAGSGNIISDTKTPTPCDGAMNAFSSGYNAGVRAAEYLKKI